MMEAVASGVVCGLIAWGGVRVELRWLRADIVRLEKRVDRVESAMIGRGARREIVPVGSES